MARIGTGGPILLAACVLLLAGCGDSGGMSTAEAEEWLSVMLEENADDGTVGKVNCLSEEEGRWQCVVPFTPAGGEKVNISGDLSCDDTDCLWRPE